MNSPWHRNAHGASHALRFNGLPATATADLQHPGVPVHARWNQAQPAHPSHPTQAVARRVRTAAWMPRLAGVLAFGALAFGVFVASSDTCAAHEAGGGSYSQSTLSPITDSGADATPANARGGACRRKHKTGRFAHPKTVP